MHKDWERLSSAEVHSLDITRNQEISCEWWWNCCCNLSLAYSCHLRVMLSILWHVSANSTRLDGLLENTVTELMICIPHPLRNHLDFTLTSTRYFLHALILHPMVLIFIQTIKEEPLNRIFWQVKKESRPLPLYETCSSNVFKTNNIITTSMILPVKWAQTRAIFFFSTAVEGKFTRVSTANHFHRDRSVDVELNLDSPTTCWSRSLSNDQLSPLSLLVRTEASFATAALWVWSWCKCSVMRKKHTKSDWHNSEEGNVVIFTKNCSNQLGYEKKKQNKQTITTLVHKLLQLATIIIIIMDISMAHDP